MNHTVYCTYFDHRYLSRGLALIESLRACDVAEEVWILCLDDECLFALRGLNLPNVRPVALAELEDAIPELAAVKSGRSTIEYYFTATPQLIRFVFREVSQADRVVYLDADLYYFAPPQLVLAEMGDAPVAIIPHNFAPPVKKFEAFGLYNVGWVGFARAPEGQACLDWWAQRCLEWCYDIPEPDRFADQKYLDHFMQIAPGTHVIWHKGVNTAPWNIGNYQVATDKDGAVTLDGERLVFFHFHGVKPGWGGYWFDSHRLYRAPHSRLIRDRIYRPYVEALVRAEAAGSPFLSQPTRASLMRGSGKPSLTMTELRQRLKTLLYRIADVLGGRPVRVPKARQ